MSEKRKLKTCQVDTKEMDQAFGKCLMQVHGKKGMWIFITAIMFLFVVSMWYCYYLNLMNITFANIGSIVFFVIACICLSFMKDRILLYEYGLVHVTMFDMHKKRIAYEDITCLLMRKLLMSQGKTIMWEIRIKNKKKGLRLDASSYKGINDCMRTLARETKIEIIS